VVTLATNRPNSSLRARETSRDARDGLGTIGAVAAPPSRRGPGRRSAGVLPLLWAVLTAGLVASCATAAEVAAPEGPTATTTTTSVRRVPAAVDGSLRAEVPALEEAGPDAVPHEVLLYGDSVALLIADDLAAELDAPLVVDAVDCRRLDVGFRGPCGGVPAGTEVASGLDDLAPATELVDDPATAAAVVVIANNAALQADDLTRAMDALGPLARVWWVTTRVDGRAWQDPNNQLLVELADRDPRAGVIDWFAASEGQDWLVDIVHPGDEGQAALAELVAAHVRCDCTP